jgi:hypothetical protein
MERRGRQWGKDRRKKESRAEGSNDRGYLDKDVGCDVIPVANDEPVVRPRIIAAVAVMDAIEAVSVELPLEGQQFMVEKNLQNISFKLMLVHDSKACWAALLYTRVLFAEYEVEFFREAKA